MDTCHAQLLSYISQHRITSYPVEMKVDDVGLEQAKQIILFMVSDHPLFFYMFFCLFLLKVVLLFFV